MSWPVVRRLLIPVLLGGAVATAVAAAPGDEFDALAAAAGEHHRALSELLALQDQDVERATREAGRVRELLARELVARRDVEEADRRVTWLRTELDKLRDEIARVDALIAEARAGAVLARIPPPARGEERQAPELLASGGRGPWSLARLPAIERFFETRFGRPLPVSAHGQTPLHDRLGFDHRHALDVAVHPDTAEGRALVAWLRSEGIPFLAFRSAEREASTGAHVHVGDPSPRLAASSPDRPRPPAR